MAKEEEKKPVDKGKGKAEDVQMNGVNGAKDAGKDADGKKKDGDLPTGEYSIRARGEFEAYDQQLICDICRGAQRRRSEAQG